jgi:DNA-binding CsgD family transcriptional regulator
MRTSAAIALEARTDVEQLLDKLLPMAQWHVVGGAGVVFTNGSGFYFAGLAEAYLDRLDEAVAHFEQAAADNERCGVLGWALAARQQLAEVLVRRGGAGDIERARRLANDALREARRLGMPPFAARADALLRELPRARGRAEGLTTRELEVAKLIAQGLTNRQLALRLGISERTAETHVDHILSKLGFVSRVQVAGWIASATKQGS